jgi:secreted trypsin-like serine protease
MRSRTARGLALRVGCLLAATVALAPAATAAAKPPTAHTSVIGGRPASLAQWGFTVAITSATQLCTGSVIAPTKVLTAAHCTGPPAQMSVIANRTSLFASDGEVRGVSGIALHPGYDGAFNDLAVLTLSSPTTAPPIALASPSDDAAFTRRGAPLEVAGFGTRNPLAFGKPKLGVLTAANVSPTTTRRCQLIYEPSIEVCDAGGRMGIAYSGRKRRPVQRGICFGDSGGPLVANTAAGPRLIGVAEGGLAPSKRAAFGFVFCGLKGFPAIHVRVAPALGFINAQL